MRKAIFSIAFLSVMSFAPDASSFAEGPKLDTEAPITKIAFGSCASQYQRQPIWNAVIAQKPQAFIFLGDNVYGDVSDEMMWELKTAYNALATHPEFTKARQAMPFLPIWDDHDYGVNDGGASFPYRKKAEDLFRAFWKIPPNKEGRPGLYRSHMIGPEGQRTQIILLDTRSFRSDLKKKKEAVRFEPYEPDPDPTKTLLGTAQWRWLENELKKPAEIRIIVSSIQVLALGHGWERWGNLPLERKKLLDLAKNATGIQTVFLSGDRHLGAIYVRDDEDDKSLYEITSSSLTSPMRRMPNEPGPLRMGQPYIDINFGTVVVDWQDKRIDLELRDKNGDIARDVSITF